MIIYYHCTRDSALLLLTCHPYILPLSFHEMIFIYYTCSTSFFRAVVSRNKKLTTPMYANGVVRVEVRDCAKCDRERSTIEMLKGSCAQIFWIDL